MVIIHLQDWPDIETALGKWNLIIKSFKGLIERPGLNTARISAWSIRL